MRDEILKHLEMIEEKKVLLDAALEKGLNRSVLSILYYICFYYVRSLLLTEGVKTRSHKQVMVNFSKYFVKTGKFPKESGRVLNDLFSLRQGCDYELIHRGDDFVNEQLVNTSVLIERGEEYLKTYLENRDY